MYCARRIDGKWVRWLGFNPKYFGGDGGLLCQDCGVALTMNSHSKHTRDRCAYWKTKRRVKGEDEEKVEKEIVVGYTDDQQDGFDVKEGGADGECDEASSRLGSDDESEQGSANSASTKDGDGAEEDMLEEGDDGEP